MDVNWGVGCREKIGRKKKKPCKRSRDGPKAGGKRRGRKPRWVKAGGAGESSAPYDGWEGKRPGVVKAELADVGGDWGGFEGGMK